jgi:hypothetical protein
MRQMEIVHTAVLLHETLQQFDWIAVFAGLRDHLRIA